MKKCISVLCVVALLVLALPLHAREKHDDGSTSKDDEVVEQIKLDIEDRPQKKSVATAALLSVVPAFGAGLYYANEYPAAISSTVSQAIGLGLLLDSLIRTHKSSTTVSGIIVLGSSWLFGVIYAPLSVHQHNKIVEKYSVRPYLDVSSEKLYAGINCNF